MRTFFSGLSSFAVSAMKWTPASTMTSASTFVASRASARLIADEIGDAMIDLRRLIIMRQDHRIALALQAQDRIDVAGKDRPFECRNPMADLGEEILPAALRPRCVAKERISTIALYSHLSIIG